jgi:archaellum biogenesis ATPase FlaH
MKALDLLTAALEYHKQGWPVVPVGPEKAACATFKQWFRRPQTAAEARDFPWARLHGLALLTWPGSELLVVDLDGPHAAQAWQDEIGIALPETATNHTRSGGIHRVYRVPPGTSRPGTADGADPRRRVRLAKAVGCGCQKPCGVDLLLNGYFIVPPTPGYWEDPDYPLEPRNIATIPQAVLDLARRRAHATPHATESPEGDWFATAIRGPVPEGQRNDTATRLAGLLLAKGHSVEHTQAILETWGRTACVPSLSPADRDEWRKLQETVKSVARKEAAKAPEQALPVLDAPVTILRRLQDRPDPIPTEIAQLDRQLRGGMRPGKAMVIGGTAGAGKTALGLQIALAAAKAGCAVAAFMADEGREPAVIRLGQQLGYIREQIEEGSDAVLDAMERELAGKVLTFPDPDAEADTTIEGVTEALVQAYASRRKLVLLDSIQTVRTRHPLGEIPSLRERIMENARTARRLAVEHGLVLVYTSEVNRSWYRSRKEEDRASDLAAFAEARIEFSGDVLLTMRASDEDPDLVDVRIPKNRLGHRMPFLLRLDRKRALFMPVDGDPTAAIREAKSSQLVDKQREAILRALGQHPDLTRQQLWDAVGGNRNAFSDALDQLKVAGVVSVTPRGRAMLHRAVPP